CGACMPLVRSIELSTKPGKKAWVVPVVDKADARTQVQGASVRFEVQTGEGVPPEGTVNRRGARCICCNSPVPFEHIRADGKAGRIGSQIMAIVLEGNRGRVYISPLKEHESVAAQASPQNVFDACLPEQALGFRVQLYGMRYYRDLFTAR